MKIHKWSIYGCVFLMLFLRGCKTSPVLTVGKDEISVEQARIWRLPCRSMSSAAEMRSGI